MVFNNYYINRELVLNNPGKKRYKPPFVPVLSTGSFSVEPFIEKGVLWWCREREGLGSSTQTQDGLLTVR